MPSPLQLIRRLRALLTRRRFDADVEEELRFHVEMETEKHLRAGMTPTAAGAAARRVFGGRVTTREEVMDAHGITPVEDLGRDLRFAVRSLRRAPGYTAVALLTLALGIGGTIAVFTVVNGTLLQSLPFPDPGHIVAVSGVTREGFKIPTSVPNFLDWKAQARRFEALAAYNTWRQNLLGGAEPQRVLMTQATGEFFPILGVAAMRGRTIQPDDQTADHPPALVLSYGFWQRGFGGDPAIVGKELGIGGGRGFVVVGIMPPWFDFPKGTEVWTSRNVSGTGWLRNSINDQVLGRIRQGSTLSDVRTEMNLIAARLKAQFPNDEENQVVSARVVPLMEELIGDVRTYLLIVQGAILCVLLVGCANLASAGVARGIQREREMAVRSAIGASRTRLVRQLLTEHLLLGVVGGLFGLGVTFGLVRAFTRFAPPDLLPISGIAPNPRVLLIGFGLSLLVGLGIGILPALLGARLDLRTAMTTGLGGNSRRRARAGWALVSAEVGLSVVLLIGSGLLIHSFGRVLAQDPGVRVDHVLTASIALPWRPYAQPEQSYAFWDRLVDQVRGIPGVLSAAAVNSVPLGTGGSGYLEVEGWEGTAGAGYRLVTDDYFKTMNVRLLRGREFTAADDSTQPHVTLINQAMADAYWKGQDPIGKRFRAKSWDSHPDVWLTVVGVVNDIRYWTLELDPLPEHFVYFRQRPDRLQVMTLMVHASGDPAALTGQIRQAIRGIDPNIPAEFSTMSTRLDDTLRQRRFVMSVLGGFAVFALFLAAFGIYGVLSFVTNARTKEIGLRVALGAPGERVLGLVFRQAALPIALGLSGGVAAALVLSRLMETLLYGIRPIDPLTYAVTPAVFGLVAGLACLIPARRALRIDPMIAIRAD